VAWPLDFFPGTHVQYGVYHNNQLETKWQFVSWYPSGCGVHVNNSEKKPYKLHLVHVTQTEAF